MPLDRPTCRLGPPRRGRSQDPGPGQHHLGTEYALPSVNWQNNQTPGGQSIPNSVPQGADQQSYSPQTYAGAPPQSQSPHTEFVVPSVNWQNNQTTGGQSIPDPVLQGANPQSYSPSTYAGAALQSQSPPPFAAPLGFSAGQPLRQPGYGGPPTMTQQPASTGRVSQGFLDQENPPANDLQSTGSAQSLPQDGSVVFYKCRTDRGMCPVAFSGTALAGSHCACIDSSTGRRDDGAIQ